MFKVKFFALRIVLVIFMVMALTPVSNVKALPNLDRQDQGGTTESKLVVGPDGKTYVVEISEILTHRPKLQSSQIVAAAASGCKTYTLGVTWKDLLGIEIWRYTQVIDWCYNGSTITSVSRYDYPTMYSPGWSYKGRLSLQVSGGVGQSSYRSRTQGWFCMIETWTCVWNVYPWMDQTVYGTGSYTGSASPN